MRLPAFLVITAFSLTVAAPPQSVAAQDGRDFVFTDDEGHLVLRFAGAQPGGLDENQMDEILNVQLSTMVHDRLRADIMFESEPVDSEWAAAIERRIERQLNETGTEFSAVYAECRSASCRLLLEHSGGRSVLEHQTLMEAAQHIVEAFIEAHPASFEPVFLIAGHYQEPDVPYTNVFLRRTTEGTATRR